MCLIQQKQGTTQQGTNNNMQAKKKKTKKEIKVQDIKPAKDPKGGLPPGPCRPGRGGALGGTKGPGGGHSVDLHI
jgi:hypothetical protein